MRIGVRVGWVVGGEGEESPRQKFPDGRANQEGIGFSFQPAIVVSRLHLINYDSAPCAKMLMPGWTCVQV